MVVTLLFAWLVFVAIPQQYLQQKHQQHRINNTALSNEFFTKACMEWKERLQEGREGGLKEEINN